MHKFSKLFLLEIFFSILLFFHVHSISLNKKEGIPVSESDCLGRDQMYAHFIDGSGNDYSAINDSIAGIGNLFDSFCGSYRHIISGVSTDFFPWPSNATVINDTYLARDFLNRAMTPYTRIFDLQTAVNSFFKDPRYSTFDPRDNLPPWAIIWTYSDTAGGMNNLYNGVERLHNEGYTVLLIRLDRPSSAKISQYVQSIPQSNIAAFYRRTDATSLISTWLYSRIYSGYDVKAVNQTGYSGTITSPNYPHDYPNYGLQDYYITAPTSYQIILTINYFEVEKDLDNLFVYKGAFIGDGDLIYGWTGNKTSANYTIQSNAVFMRFLTNWSGVFPGFQIFWTAVYVPPQNKLQ